MTIDIADIKKRMQKHGFLDVALRYCHSGDANVINSSCNILHIVFSKSYFSQATAEAICRRINIFGLDEETKGRIIFISLLIITVCHSNSFVLFVLGLSFSGREFDDLTTEEQRLACMNARLVRFL